MTVLPPQSVIDTIANCGSPVRRASLHANHVLVVVRYGSPTTGIGKVAYKSEIDALLADGFGVVANYERSAGDWRLGPDVARQAGAWMRNYVSGTGTTKVNGVVVPCWGWPRTVPILYSIDTGVLTSELPLAASVMRAFSEPSGFPQGIYGPSNVGVYCVTVGAASIFWQWKDGWRPDTIHTDIRQLYTTPFEFVPPFSYDSNRPVTEYFGQFYGAAPPPPPPPPGRTQLDMADLIQAHDGSPAQQFATFAWNGINISWVTSDEAIGLGKISGVYKVDDEGNTFKNFSAAQIQDLIDRVWAGGPVPPGYAAPTPPPPPTVNVAAIATATRDEFVNRPLK